MPHGIFPADLAKLYVEDAGQQWTPSNGTDGELFQDAWCSHCSRDRVANGTVLFHAAGDDDMCQILGASYRGEATEWQIGADGQPQCTAFTPAGEPTPTPRCEHTIELPLEPPVESIDDPRRIEALFAADQRATDEASLRGAP